MRSADLTDLTLETNTGLGHYDVINITDYMHACMYMHAKTSHNSTFCTCTVSSCGHQLSIRCFNIDILMDSWNDRAISAIPSTITSTTAQARTGELVGPLSSIPVGPPTVPHSAKSSHTLPVV